MIGTLRHRIEVMIGLFPTELSLIELFND